MTKTKSAKCSACPYTVRLRKDGTVQAHWLYGGIRDGYCEGGGKPPREGERK